MPAMKRFKTTYPGVHYIVGKAVGSKRKERIYYIVYRRNGRLIEERVGRQFQDDMTPQEARRIRIECLEGKRMPRREMRKQAGKKQEAQGSTRIPKSEEGDLNFSVTTEDLLRIKNAIETSGDAIGVANAEGNLIYHNKALTDMFGYTVEELGASERISMIYANQDVAKTVLSTIESGEAWSGEVEMLAKDGRKFPVSLRADAIRDDNGNMIGIVGVHRDITDQKTIQKALRQSEERFRQLAAELEMKNVRLEEMNAALRILLQKREEDKSMLEEKLMFSIEDLIKPYLQKLKDTALNENQERFLNIIETNLNDIISPFMNLKFRMLYKLTPSEIQVANFVKHGKTTKEIAEILSLSGKTIESHRKNIRKKLGIKNKRENLRTHLLGAFSQ